MASVHYYSLSAISFWYYSTLPTLQREVIPVALPAHELGWGVGYMSGIEGCRVTAGCWLFMEVYPWMLIRHMHGTHTGWNTANVRAALYLTFNKKSFCPTGQSTLILMILVMQWLVRFANCEIWIVRPNFCKTDIQIRLSCTFSHILDANTLNYKLALPLWAR